MKKIGVLGGLSWVSTAEYYRRLNEITQEHLGGVNSARIALESVNRQTYVEAVIDRGDEDAACEIILDAARSVERAGAEFIVISCNDVHRFVPQVEPHIAIPFLHIAAATAEAIKQTKLDRVALLGVRKTMEEPFYPEILKTHGIGHHYSKRNGKDLHSRHDIWRARQGRVPRRDPREICQPHCRFAETRGARRDFGLHGNPAPDLPRRFTNADLLDNGDSLPCRGGDGAGSVANAAVSFPSPPLPARKGRDGHGCELKGFRGN